MVVRIINLSGQRFGRLVALEVIGRQARAAVWKCRCDCGTYTNVVAASLKRAHTSSCGCLHREKSAAVNTVHGDWGSGSYQSWHGMMQRCTNPNNKKYSRYGGRGITVCDRWKDYSAFLEDMGPRPEKLTIERLDNSKGYSKSNCKWATKAEQNRNHCRNRLLTYQGRSMIAPDWAKELGLPMSCISGRLKRGWSVDKALSLPLNSYLKVADREEFNAL